MQPMVTILAVAAVAAVVAWLLGAARARASAQRQVADAEARARAAEEVRRELRQQVDRQAGEITKLYAALDVERRARTEAHTRLEAAQQHLQDERRLLDEATARLGDTFKALSSEALRSNNQSFLDLARQALDTVVAESRGDIGKRQEAIDALIRPLHEVLQRYERQVLALEESRQKTMGGLEEQLKSLGAAQGQLQRETGNLVAALRSPHVRGRWGEITLHRVVELAGMAEHCDYFEQATVEGSSGRQRPDMVVRLPAGREIVVDAKVSLDGYLDAVAATTDEGRQAALARHAQQIRAHMQQLAAKSYWDQFPRAPEFVVMFIPGESLFAAALTQDRALLEDGMARQVVLATPTTLIAVLKAVAYGWRQERVAENAQAISDLGRQLYERLRRLAEHVEEVGRALGKAVGSYNRAVASMETRVFPAARRFKELGAATGDEIPVAPIVDQAPRLFADLDKET